MLYDELDDPSDPGGEGAATEEEESPSSTTENSQEPPTPTEGQTPFSHPSLEGLSEAEVAERLAVSESTIKAQRKRMNELESIASRPAAPAQEEEEGERDPQKFFEDPYGEIGKIIEKQLTQAVAPLAQDLKSRRVQGIYDSLAQEYPNFGQFKGAVAEQIKLWGIPDDAVNEDLVRTTFLSKVGEASLSTRQNGRQDETEARQEPQPEQPRVSPQHRPSSHPPKEPKADAPRALTEEEKRFARIQFPKAKDPYKEYREWADAETNEDGAFILEDEEA